MELRIDRLSKTYPNGTRALRDVSLTIPRGMFGLLGPNGAGKSTLMRIVATLQEPDTGSVRFDVAVPGGSERSNRPDGPAPMQIDVLRDKRAMRRVLGYLPQEFGLYPKVSAVRLLDHFAVLEGILDRHERRSVVEHLLKHTNLWQARKVKLGEYSGGMRQRFGIAVALLGSPQLIIVDEPTAGLDPEERVRFLNLLAELGRESVVILSTHIVDDVAELCSRMAIIDGGRIRLEAEPVAAIAALRGKVWRKLIGHDELPAYRERFRVLSNRLNLGRNAVRVLHEVPPSEADEGLGEGFEPVEPDLEDVYFSTLRFGESESDRPGDGEAAA